VLCFQPRFFSAGLNYFFYTGVGKVVNRCSFSVTVRFFHHPLFFFAPGHMIASDKKTFEHAGRQCLRVEIYVSIITSVSF